MAERKKATPPKKAFTPQTVMAQRAKKAAAAKAAAATPPRPDKMPFNIRTNIPGAKPKMRSTTNDKPLTEKEKAKGTARGLKGANKTPKNRSTGVTRGSLYAARPGYTGSSSGRVGINYSK